MANLVFNNKDLVGLISKYFYVQVDQNDDWYSLALLNKTCYQVYLAYLDSVRQRISNAQIRIMDSYLEGIHIIKCNFCNNFYNTGQGTMTYPFGCCDITTCCSSCVKKYLRCSECNGINCRCSFKCACDKMIHQKCFFSICGHCSNKTHSNCIKKCHKCNMILCPMCQPIDKGCPSHKFPEQYK
jgi:hypothetical protein